MKIQRKIMYIWWTESPDSLKNSNSFNVQNHQSLMKICVHSMYRVCICGKIQIRWMYDIEKIKWKIVYIWSSNGPNKWKNSNQYSENSIKNCAH